MYAIRSYYGQPDIFWTIRQIVKRRDSIKKRYVILENQLHNQLMYNYPSYRNFFSEIDGKTALYFWEHYPSPMYLKGISAQALAEDLRSASRNACVITSYSIHYTKLYEA